MTLDSASEYGLSFGGDAVHLQKRERPAAGIARVRQPAWRHLGSVDFDEPDFREMLVNLRMMATGQGEDVAMPVTLVIPDDQILYTTLTVPPSGDRERAVARALDGLTPYAIDELSFDWRGDEDNVRVAAVARQTLREARDFAAQYGFEGEGFCAEPDPELFAGEPVFLLEAPTRHRPVIDPGSASVTSSGLMIEAEPETVEPASAPAPVAPAAPEVAPEIVAAPEPAGEPAPGPVLTVIPPPEAEEGERLREIAASMAHAPSAASSMPMPAPVVRHAPARPAPAPAAPEAPAMASPLLSARARAVHKRAAEARQAKPASASAAAPVAPPRASAQPRRRGLGTLAAMMIMLVVGLVLIWAFVVPRSNPAQVAAAPDPTAPTAAVIDAPTPVAQTPAAPVPVIEETVEAAPAAAAAAVVAQPPQAPAVPEAKTAPLESSAPPPRRLADLAPADARKVLVAASATAAAVVSSGSPAKAEAKAEAAAQPQTPPPAKAPLQPKPKAAEPAADAAAAKPAPVAKPAAPVVAAPTVTSSARPQLSPRRSTPQTSEPRADTPPNVPESPLPYTASQKSGQPANSARPPQRKRVDRSGSADTHEHAPVENARVEQRGRPPLRPEGSAPELAADEAETLAPEEQRQLEALILDMRGHGLVPTVAIPDGAGARFADARPKRKPKSASDAVSPAAVEAALKSASDTPPSRNAGSVVGASSRPVSRPGNHASTAKISDDAVEKAIAAAVDASPAIPNAIKLSSSPLPPRRSGAAPDESPAAPDVPAAAAAVAAAPVAAGPSEAEIAARRALDEQLQAQAEARIRARAQADAAAEAQARAQAEARARAQAEAEERAARARKQVYKPQEIDDEPEIAANVARGGSTSASVAANATQRRGMDTGRTTIIGIIGAGRASRALIRLRNGKVVTVRMGDKIDGGTINSIGDGRLTYVKAGRQRELRLLDGR